MVENFLKYFFLNGLVIREMSDLWLRLLHHDYWPRGWVHCGALSSINIIFTSTYNYFNWLSFQRNRLNFELDYVLPMSQTFFSPGKNFFQLKKDLNGAGFFRFTQDMAKISCVIITLSIINGAWRLYELSILRILPIIRIDFICFYFYVVWNFISGLGCFLATFINFNGKVENQA